VHEQFGFCRIKQGLKNRIFGKIRFLQRKSDFGFNRKVRKVYAKERKVSQKSDFIANPR